MNQTDANIAVINRIHGRIAKRLVKLETCAVIDAETIGHVAELRRIVTEQAKRIERLEAALNFSNGATYTAERAKQIEDWGGGTR